jgi:hypothetical protein
MVLWSRDREEPRAASPVKKTLEDANIKLDSVITDVMGMSGRAMIPPSWLGLLIHETPYGGSWRSVGSHQPRHLRSCTR